MSNKFVLKKGLSKVFAAEILSADNEEGGGYKTGDPFHLIPAGEMSRVANNEKTDIYFDNSVFDTTGTEAATAITITGAALRPADLAKINNKYVDETTGAILDSGEFKPKYFALGGETKNTDGTLELFWFAKGTFAIPEQTDKTEDESTDTNGMTLTYSAVKTQHLFELPNGEKHPHKRTVIDTSVSELVDGAKWTDQVVTPENLSTIVKKKATV